MLFDYAYFNSRFNISRKRSVREMFCHHAPASLVGLESELCDRLQNDFNPSQVYPDGDQFICVPLADQVSANLTVRTTYVEPHQIMYKYWNMNGNS